MNAVGGMNRVDGTTDGTTGSDAVDGRVGATRADTGVSVIDGYGCVIAGYPSAMGYV